MHSLKKTWPSLLRWHWIQAWFSMEPKILGNRLSCSRRPFSTCWQISSLGKTTKTKDWVDWMVPGFKLMRLALISEHELKRKLICSCLMTIWIWQRWVMLMILIEDKWCTRQCLGIWKKKLLFSWSWLRMVTESNPSNYYSFYNWSNRTA